MSLVPVPEGRHDVLNETSHQFVASEIAEFTLALAAGLDAPLAGWGRGTEGRGGVALITWPEASQSSCDRQR
jgi:hypothetical protein